MVYQKDVVVCRSQRSQTPPEDNNVKSVHEAEWGSLSSYSLSKNTYPDQDLEYKRSCDKIFKVKSGKPGIHRKEATGRSVGY